MKRFAAFLAMVAAVLSGSAAIAQDLRAARTIVVESWIEEWDPVAGRWVRVADEVPDAAKTDLPVVTTTFVNGTGWTQPRSATRFALPTEPRPAMSMLGRYGPFVVSSPTRAVMVGSTDGATPRQFDAMMRDFPHLAVLELVEAPGTSNDIANLAVGRRIREAGLRTHVPRGGSVRSGAVELFLAGVTRTVEDGAQFAVHSWLDNHGREADDLAPDHPAHRLYLDYYMEMGMSEARARSFYAMTNSVPHASALWLASRDMRYWLRPERPASLNRVASGLQAGPRIPYIEVPNIAVGVIALARLDLSSLDSRAGLP